MFDITNDDNGE